MQLKMIRFSINFVFYLQKSEEQAEFDNQWPPCNSEWSQDSGRRVWCTEKRLVSEFFP